MTTLGNLLTYAADGLFQLGNVLNALAVPLLDRTEGER